MKFIKIDNMIAEINEPIQEQFTVQFGGDYQLQITHVDGAFKVTNGVNGWGNNCRSEFEEAEIKILEDITNNISFL